MKSAHWGYRAVAGPDALSLLPADVDHRVRIYRARGVAPESLERVTAEFILQRHRLCRHIIKELDILLAVGGEFVVVLVNSKSHASYFRSRDQVKYEFAVSTDGRYRLADAERSPDDQILTLRYVKTRPVLPAGDTLNRWSFGIITDGRKKPLVDRLVRSIASQGIAECEILVCGPYAFEDTAATCSLRLIDDVSHPGDIRAPITAKKNRIIRAAAHNNLCILHDRFVLPPDWHDKFTRYGNHFELLCLPTVDDERRRFSVDWMRFSLPLTSRVSRNQSLPYHEWTDEVIVQGGVIVAKRHVIESFKLDERLHWEELEDMQFSKAAYLHGAFINVDPENCFISEAVNHRPSGRRGATRRFREWGSWYRRLLTSALHFNRAVRSFSDLKRQP